MGPDIAFNDIVKEAVACLKLLTDLKAEMITQDEDLTQLQRQHVSDKILDSMDPQMVLYNLYDMTQDVGMENYLHGDEYNLKRWKDEIKLVVEKRTKKTMFDTEDKEDDNPS